MNTFFLSLTLILLATCADIHNRAVGAAEKHVEATPDRLGVD